MATEHMTPASDLSTISAVAPFNEADTHAIIRQVEYYFSDQNLPHDAHLLGLAGGDGNGPVSVNQISGFKKMRQYKPSKAVKDVLERSAVLELSQDRKKIKRRFPLQLRVTVRPKIDLERKHIDETLAANPHMTKGMLKPTGFEEYYADAPVTPEQYARDRKLYHEDSSFETRIENALAMYKAKRKLHQSTAKVFDMWMNFGGIDMVPGVSGDAGDLEGLEKDDIICLQSPYSVSDTVVVNEELFQVDFKKVALSFLSTEFPSFFRPDFAGDITTVCSVMINFLNYLLHHDVCPEYSQQIFDTRSAITAAEGEMHQLIEADRALNADHGFQTACKVLHELPKSEEDPWDVADPPYSIAAAKAIFQVGLAALGTEDQLKELEERSQGFKVEVDKRDDRSWNNKVVETTAEELDQSTPADDDEHSPVPSPRSRFASAGWTMEGDTLMPPMPLYSPFAVVASEEIGLEIMSLRSATGEAKQLFDSLSTISIESMGIMQCRRCDVAGRKTEDLEHFGQRLGNDFQFIVEESVINACKVGMKLQCMVRQLDIGICWLEHIERTLPSFYDFMPEFRKVKAHFQRLDEAEVAGAEAISATAADVDRPAVVEPVC